MLPSVWKGRKREKEAWEIKNVGKMENCEKMMKKKKKVPIKINGEKWSLKIKLVHSILQLPFLSCF